jgi:DNA-directed RNA polymerase specialized sigma24 family protein
MLWSITDDDVAAAQRGDAAALGRVYQQSFPVCARITNSLTGRADTGTEITRELRRQFTDQLPRFRDADDLSRWLTHHTILLKRRLAKPPRPGEDVLLAGVGGPDAAAYRAMINALRRLSPQQQEAFILTHAQRWNTRLCAVAMDCSNTAVETHLEGADREIRPLLGENFAALTQYLEQVHKSQPVDIAPPPTIIAATIKVRRGFGLLKTFAGWAAIVAFFLLAGAFVVFVLPAIDY